MNSRFLKKRLLFFTLFIYSWFAFGQQSIIDASILTDYNNALKLYNSKAYAAAQKTFKKVSINAENGTKLKSDASYFEAMCAVKLNQTNADEKVLNFVEENPTSTKKNKAYFNVANYYFANRKAAYSLKWYQKVDIDQLSKENRKELNFKMGYCFVITNNLTLAKEKFLPLINDAKYGNDSRYYYGYVAYKLEDYGIAESTLKEIADNESYRAEISYYLLDISFKAGKFKRCIKVGEELLKTARKKDISEISKIVGESYFNTKKYAKAIPYLKAYKGKKGKLNNTDYYQLGYAYYKQNDFEKAISYFNKIIDEKNTVAQNAYYHLGECYLNLNKKSEALNAFKTASEMTYNNTIAEDSALNYAKLSYESGNPFKSVPEVLQDYLKKYPKSKYYEEINGLIVSSFIHQQNYEGALNYLKKNKRKAKENNKLIHEVSLYRGIQLFNNKDIVTSISFFEDAIQSENIEIKQKAKYWEAEATYRLKKYNDALTKFKALQSAVTSPKVEELSLLNYNIGYTYFKLKDYKNSAIYFKNFIKLDSLENNIKDDAQLRLGDSYFATSNFSEAIKYYSDIIKNYGTNADYAEYQVGMSYGFMDNNDKKIKSLTNVVNNYQSSSLKDDALYQLATTYTKVKNNLKAHQAYDRLLEKHPKSIFTPKALVRQGLLYFNENNNKKALEKFKLTAAKFPNSPDALEAVANARNVYIELGDLSDYVDWIKTLKFINISNSDLDNTSFAVAEKLYLDSKDGLAIVNSLKKYIISFPEGIHYIKANYYLADILYRVKEYKQAIVYYTVVIEEEQTDFSEDSLAKLSEIYLKQEKFNDALPLLDRLEQEAYAIENVLFAQSNLMKGYYETNGYDFAIEYAKKILAKDKIDKALENDAKIIIARASFKKEDYLTAEEYYEAIEREANGVLKAEALYYKAFFKNQQKEYESSNKVVQKLISKYSAYKYWAVKSYVIMGKNYYGLKDVYQATFVLENIIKNFKQFKDIINEAKTELNTIKENEAKTNNSINPTKEKVKKDTKN